MKKIIISKCHKSKKTKIIIKKRFKEINLSLEEKKALYQYEAKKIADLLCNVLPGYTLQILIEKLKGYIE